MSKSIRRIPTILALFFLLLGVAVAVVLIHKGPSWFVGARPELTPKQVKITNISENGFTVSWITDEKTNGFIQYGPEGRLSLTMADDRDQFSGQQGSFWTHHITIKNLEPSTKYLFKINSEGRVFDNNGQSYQVTTASVSGTNVPSSDVAYGTVLNQEGLPVEGVVVYLSLANTTPLSTLTRSSGSWLIPLNAARSADLSTYASYDREASVEEIFVQGGFLGTATVLATTKYDSPLPAITLGQSFDFRSGTAVTGGISPTPTTSSSRFPHGLTIINPSLGEKINTPKPEIMGTGPAGQELTVVVNSSNSFTAQVTIGEDGTWSWTPPSGLSPGEHTVTVSLADGGRISRAFTVLAAGASELPSFTATPSATLTPSPTATPSPTPTPTLTTRISLPSTEGGVPQPGYLTPTVFVFIMGVVLIFLGLVSNILFKKF